MDAVVFDFDGVLCNSMPQHAEAYRHVLRPLGITVEDHRVFELEGARSESVIRALAQDAGTALDTEAIRELADKKQAVYRGLGDPPIYDGARAMVLSVQERRPTALVTGTRRENLDRLMGDLIEGFEAVLAQDAYTHDKPDPEPFAKAAQALRIQPSRCIAVENAPRGVQSAKAAGYGHVIAITTTMDARALQEADEVFVDHLAMRDGLLRHLQGMPQQG